MGLLWLALPIVISSIGIVAMLVRRARRVAPTPRELGSLLASGDARMPRSRRPGKAPRSRR